MAKFHASSILVCFLTILNDLGQYDVKADRLKCEEDQFYLPYVHVRKKKNGGNIASLKSSGFLDLRFRNRVLLCLNGPVMLYSDVERLDPDAKVASEPDQSKDSLNSMPEIRHPANEDGIPESAAGDVRFKKGELLAFRHECISINKIPIAVLKKMKQDQGKTNPEIMADTAVNGKLVLGVYLIANEAGYNRPELTWFKGENFDYILTADKTIKETSFVLSGSNVSHCIRLPDGTQVKVGFSGSASNTSHEVCRWTVQDADKPWYSKVFQRGFDGNGVRTGEPTLDESDYEFYDCPDGDPDRHIILTMSKTTPEPVTHANYTEFDPFSLFNPNMWTPHGYRKDSNGLSGGDERSEDRAMSAGVPQESSVPCSLDPSNPNCLDSGDLEMTTIKDMQNVEPTLANSYEIVVGECIPLPMFDMTECTGIGNNGARLLELVLELEPKYVVQSPVAVGGEITEANRVEFPHYKNIDFNQTLAWKYDLMYLVSDIFSNLCMPFRQEMPYAVARVMAWYVYKAHTYGTEMGRAGPPPVPETPPLFATDDIFNRWTEKGDPWPVLFKELERCQGVSKTENAGKGLKFQWEIGDDTGKWKVPAVDGRLTKRRKKREATSQKTPVKPAYETKRKRSTVHDEEIVEEINAETGEKILSRQKRAGSYKINGSVITTKYVQHGKTLTSVKSEGVWGYAREAIQEYKKKPDLNDPRADSAKYMEYPENIQHCWNPQEDPTNKQIVCSKTEDLFFYEDRAEIQYELNIAIDMWWKIWATVIGYCNKAYHSRKSETFPRLYNAKHSYFFDLVKSEWIHPEDNADLKIILSEFLTEESHIWMDACLEAAYINSNSQSYRPPRPLAVSQGAQLTPNYFEELPPYIYYRYHPQPGGP